jgi:hypothetical protein
MDSLRQREAHVVAPQGFLVGQEKGVKLSFLRGVHDL